MKHSEVKDQSTTTTAYNASAIEEKWNAYWFAKGLFNLKITNNAPVFSIALPPPNITGNLHMGHALNGTLQDILIRWKRMQGYCVHWQPGTDHAGIATQMVVERQLKKEGKNRHDLGREKFLEACWLWREKYGNTIYSQYKRLGVSFSWDHLVFTMDESYVKAIYRAFSILYKEGFIYRGKRVTNWCPACQTSLSDLEVEHEETKGHLYLIKYLLSDNTTTDKRWLTVATTRPETLFGDVAVAVNPADQRYKNFSGKSVLLPLTNRIIPVICDDYVDKEFGTGALKITPAHDMNDWEIGQRHNLNEPVVIDKFGKLTTSNYVPSHFHGMERFAARASVVEELQAKELLVETQDYVHSVSYCERCHTVLEPYLSEQWYVRMKELAQPAIAVVESKEVQFVPDRYVSTYLSWMRNIRDWCISRQLWWGHRIPIWTCLNCQHQDAYETSPLQCPKCSSNKLEQDPDVLDTWFSSALWPFATLGWPDKTKEMTVFYPTSILSTAREIINLWVARMIFTSLKFIGSIPFHTVLIHPVVQTADGKRMSKSKGNAIDPLDMIDKYGADANRFYFATLGIKGDQDVRFRETRLEEYKKFVNKIHNAGKFVLMQMKDKTPVKLVPTNLTLADRWILSCYHRLLGLLNKSLSNYDFDDASIALYNFTWDFFCDWYIEIAKKQILSEKEPHTSVILTTIFEGLTRAMHPIMPYITEELWQHLPKDSSLNNLESIMLAPYPQVDDRYLDAAAETKMDLVMKVIRSIRNIRHTYNIDPSVQVEIFILCTNDQELRILQEGINYIQSLAVIKTLTLLSDQKSAPINTAAKEIVSQSTIFMPLAKLIDVEKTKAKLLEKQTVTEKKWREKTQLFSNEDFRKKAPGEKVEHLQQEINELVQQLTSIAEQLNTVKAI